MSLVTDDGLSRRAGLQNVRQRSHRLTCRELNARHCGVMDCGLERKRRRNAGASAAERRTPPSLRAAAVSFHSARPIL